LLRSIAAFNRRTLREAASREAGRKATLSASMQTVSMLWASSKTTTHSFSRSRETRLATLGSSMYW
jgi:hypothetical protein